MSFIHGERTLLRPVEESDYEHFYAWMNDPEIAWWMDYEHPYSPEDIAADIEQAKEEGLPFTITVDGRPIGRIGLNRFRRRDQIAATYMFIGEPDMRSKGLGRDAMVALLNFAFHFKGLRLVELMVLGENDAAIAAYKACGFRHDATLRDRSWKFDRWMDHILMSVTRDEFAEVLGEVDLARPGSWDAGHE